MSSFLLLSIVLLIMVDGFGGGVPTLLLEKV
jgi:hypothetical protein